MARKANPAMIGAFVLGAVFLGVAALVVFGGGKFFRRTQPLVAYFEGSLKGMAIGAPVTFNGVKIGSVTDFKVIVGETTSADHIAKTSTITTPVYFEIDADRVYAASGEKIKFKKGAAGLRTLYEKGFRAQLDVASLVTGQLEVALNFFPGTPLRLTGLSKDIPEVPTIPSSIEKLSKTLDKLPLDEMIADVRQTLDTINTLVNSPEVKTTLRDLSRAVANADKLITNADKLLANTDKLVVGVNAEVPALMASVNKTGESARATLNELQAVVTRVGGVAEAALAQYQQLAVNADAQLAPLMVNVNKMAVSADKTLLQAERALTSVESAINEDSPLRYDVVKALREVQGAARSIRILMEYLDQHPEAVISGKRAEGMR